MNNKKLTHPARKPLVACLALALAIGAADAASPAVAAQRNVDVRLAGAHLLKRNPARAPVALRPYIEQARKDRQAALHPVMARPASTLVVDSCADDSSPGTLRDAVTNAVDGDTIDMTALACSTITLTQGSIAINVDNLTIQGPGAGALTVDAAGMSTVFDFFGYEDPNENPTYGTLSISGLTVTNGLYDGAGGGAIWTSTGHDLVLADSAVTNSRASGKYAGGGGIFSNGNVTLSGSTISGNSATSSKYDGSGGGVYAAGNLTIVGSTLSGNTINADQSYEYCDYYDPTACTTYPGGGLGGGAFGAANVTISNSTFSGNSASQGGGVFATGDLVFQANTVALNIATMDNNSADATTTIDGGGVFATSAAITLDSSILFGNEAAGSALGVDFALSGGSLAGGNNLVGDSAATLPGDTLSVDPMLGPLADNGGATMTHALLAGSPAIDVGNNAAGLSTDQRGPGFARVVGAAADIGAFEVQGGAVDDTIFKDGFEEVMR